MENTNSRGQVPTAIFTMIAGSLLEDSAVIADDIQNKIDKDEDTCIALINCDRLIDLLAALCALLTLLGFLELVLVHGTGGKDQRTGQRGSFHNGGYVGEHDHEVHVTS